MTIPFYLVSVFSNNFFSGNPAAVCLLDQPLSDQRCLQIANTLAQPVVAFVLASDLTQDQIRIRWFTPDSELHLCGHGSAAAAAVLFQKYTSKNQIQFQSAQFENLIMNKVGNQIQLKLAEKSWEKITLSQEMIDALGVFPKDTITHAERLCVIVNFESEVENYVLNIEKLKKLPFRGITMSALSERGDIVMRTFYPNKTQYTEDAVCGAVHAMLVPYFSTKLSRSHLEIRHLSKRGGKTICEYHSDLKQISLKGDFCIFSEGQLLVV